MASEMFKYFKLNRINRCHDVRCGNPKHVILRCANGAPCRAPSLLPGDATPWRLRMPGCTCHDSGMAKLRMKSSKAAHNPTLSNSFWDHNGTKQNFQGDSHLCQIVCSLRTSRHFLFATCKVLLATANTARSFRTVRCSAPSSSLSRHTEAALEHSIERSCIVVISCDQLDTPTMWQKHIQKCQKHREKRIK